MVRPKDLTGERRGKLVVVKRAPSKKYGGQSHLAWECLCDCGRTTIVTGANLWRSTRSCGCSRGSSIRKSKQKEQGHSGLTIVFNDYRGSARSRGLTFELTREQIGKITSQVCSYCGAAPLATTRNGIHRSEEAAVHALFPHNGIDRLDPALGYTMSNSVPCCGRCNYAKHTCSKEEFLEMVDAVYNYQKTLRTRNLTYAT